MKTHSGFASVLILIMAIFAAAVIGGGAYFVKTQSKAQTENSSVALQSATSTAVATTTEQNLILAKILPNGSNGRYPDFSVPQGVVADPSTFASAGYYMKTAGSFYKDSKYLYWVVLPEPLYNVPFSITRVANGDPATFHVLRSGLFDADIYAADKNQFYCGPRPFSTINPADAKVTAENGSDVVTAGGKKYHITAQYYELAKDPSKTCELMVSKSSPVSAPSSNPTLNQTVQSGGPVLESCKQNDRAAIQSAVDKTTSKITVNRCTVGKNIAFEGGLLSTISIYRSATDPGDDFILPVSYIILPDGSLQSLNIVSSNNPVTKLLSNLDTIEWIDRNINNSAYVLQNGKLCSRWTAQYPLQGFIQNCENGASGTISYIPNVMTWASAKNIASKEFAKYTYGTYVQDFYDYNWTFKTDSLNSPAHYIFTRTISFTGQNGGVTYNPIVVRVFADGTSNSVELKQNCGYVCRADVNQY